MQLSLERITTRIAENVKLRLVFYLAAALLSILIIGYHFGTFDQSVHIPFLKATVYKSLYSNDPFIGLRKDQYSYFWYFFTPFLNAGLLELALFIVHFLSTTMHCFQF
jgi:hypothetical protein